MLKYSQFAKTLGYYIPNRFILNLPEVHLPITSSSPEEFTVFIHEYTHLLQNVFTVSGWTSLAFEMLKYEALMKISFRDKKYDIPVYYNHELASEESKIEHCIQYAEYLFQSDSIAEDAIVNSCHETHDLQIEIINDFPLGYENKGINVYSYFLVDGKRTKIDINYFTLIESMAYIIEKHYSLATIPSPDYPYNIISTLFSTTEIESISQQIVMIYLSLQSQFPHILFRKIYNTVLSYELYLCTSIQEFTDQIINVLSDDFKNTLPKHIKMLANVFSQLSDQLNQYPLAEECVKWFNHCSNSFFQNITTNPLKYIKPILNRLGSIEIFNVVDNNYFLVKDFRNKLSVFKKDIQVDTSGITFLSNVFHFLDYFLFYDDCNLDEDDWKCCPLYYSCSLCFKNDNCLSHPYKQGEKKINGELCDYGSVAHMFFVHEVPIRILKNV